MGTRFLVEYGLKLYVSFSEKYHEVVGQNCTLFVVLLWLNGTVSIVVK